MKMRGFTVLMAALSLSQVLWAQTNRYYPSGRAPLLATAYVKLPFGAIHPLGWLDTQLVLQGKGLTGHLDEVDNQFSTPSSLNTGLEYQYCYYEGLVPLAYLLNDSTLIKKAIADVNYFINSATANGNYLNSTEGFDHASINRMMVEYYEITNDSRVIPFMTKYMHFIDSAGLAGDVWSMNREGEHLSYAYWLYNRTGDTMILNAISRRCLDTIKKWETDYLNFPFKDSTTGGGAAMTMYTHNVNNSEALKNGLYYLQSKDTNYRSASFQGLADLDKYDGQPCGRYNADEHLHGKKPTQGLECCGVCEMAYSMEKLFEAFGTLAIADRTEYLLYNSFTGTSTGDMWCHQYNQQANQVLVNNASRPWLGDGNASNEYGLAPNYPCCTANFNQPWPRFVEHMWMATQDNGLIAALYGPCQVSALVGSDSANVTITENTQYPFDGTMGFKIALSKTDSFPLYFRIPQWESNASIQSPAGTANPAAGSLYAVNRTWHTGDSVTLTFSMAIRTEFRWNNAICVMRGPLWYSLKIGETWKQLASYGQGSRDWEIDPTTAWNVALKIDPLNPAGSFTVVRNPISRVPFAQKGEQVYLPGATSFTTWTQDPPVVLEAKGRIDTAWKMNGANAGDDPVSPLASTVAGRDTTIELIPYGTAKLRVTEMPWINTPVGVRSSVQAFKDQELEVNVSENGKCLFTVQTPGAFKLVLLDISGRIVYRQDADGPKSFILERGMVPNGTYVAHIVSGGRNFEKKIFILQ